MLRRTVLTLQGNSGREMGQGQSPATFTDPFVQRQGACREASDGKQWQTNPQRRRSQLENAGTKSRSHPIAHPTRIPPAPITASVHSQKQWCETAPLDPEMGWTLPFFPGDVRDSMCSPPGELGTPIHHHSATLPQITMHDECAVASTAFGRACAAR